MGEQAERSGSTDREVRMSRLGNEQAAENMILRYGKYGAVPTPGRGDDCMFAHWARTASQRTAHAATHVRVGEGQWGDETGPGIEGGAVGT